MNNSEKNWDGKRSRSPNFEVVAGDEPRTIPNSKEAEEQVIACCLLDGSDSISRALTAKISGDAFYQPANRILFELIVELYRSRPPVTLEMVAEELMNRRQLEIVGGMPYLMQVTGKAPTTAHAGYFIEQIKQKWVLRGLIKEATEALAGCFSFTGAGEDTLENLIAPLATKFNRAAEYARAGLETMQQQAERGYARTLQKLENKHDTSRQIFTGMAEFDRRFGAFDVFEEDWLIGVAAATSGGKSAFTRKVMDHNLRAGKKGLVFLLETSLAKYLDLAACTAARINAKHLHELPADMKTKFIKERALRQSWINERLWIYDDNVKAELICARIEDHVRQHGMIDFVVIDHLHELYSTSKFNNRENELGYIAKLLKKTAKRLNVPFFVPTQLNRSPNKDGISRRPTKHDLRGSGEIEAAYDRLLLLNTPKMDMRGAEQTDNQARVMVEVIQDKSRNGPIGHREFWFDRPYTDYVEIGDGEFNRPAGATASGGSYAGMTKTQFKGEKK